MMKNSNDDEYELSSDRLEIPLDVRRKTGEKRSIRIISNIYKTYNLNCTKFRALL